MERPPVQVAAPRAAYMWLAATCALMIPVVRVLGRAPRPTDAATWALAAAGALFVLNAVIHRPAATGVRRGVELATLAALGGLTGVVGWFFGPNSGFAAFVAFVMILTGVLARTGTRAHPAAGGWITYLALALGQATALGLVMTGRLPDQSLLKVIIPGHPMWQHPVAHLALHGVFLAAFLSGRAFQRRYQALGRQVDDAMRAAARREALLDEARSEYKRALAAGRQSVDDAARPLPAPPRPRAEPDPGAIGDTIVAARTPAALRATAADDDLTSALREHGPLAPGDLRRLIIEVCDGLEAQHARGLAHFEVGPRYLQRTPGGGWKLLDVGAVPPAAAIASDMDQGVFLRYLAPERFAGQLAGAPSDLYGLAACVYAATTGIDPFAEVPVALLAGAVIAAAPLAPSSHVPVGEDVDLALRIGLAKTPAERFASAAELRDALLAALDGKLDDALRTRARALPPWGAAARPDELASTLLGPRPAAATAAAATALPEATPSLPSAASLSSPLPADIADVPDDDPALVSGLSLSSAAPEQAWQEAYREKMRGFTTSVTVLCIGGALLFAAVGREPVPRQIALASLTAILAAAWLHRALTRRRPTESAYWLWALVGVLSAGPAYSFGLLSAFAAVVAAWLFSGGMFRAAQRRSWLDGRGIVLAGVILSHSAMLALLLAGMLPDAGNLRVRADGAPLSEPIILHLLLIAIYCASFIGGVAVDRRYQQLSSRAREAIREAARQEALLASARKQLDRALRDEHSGIFTGLRIARYQLGRVLGRGGMGEVYEAIADGGRRVALKLVRGDRVAEPQSLQMFLTEAEALGRVQSAHVAKVVDVAGLTDEMPFIAMEYIDGRSLAQLLRERQRLAPDEVQGLIRDVARGVGDVHAAGVVHRDLKPHNVIRTVAAGQAHWKLVDFGVAMLSDPGGGPTRQAVAGTPSYMAPEQALGDKVDGRADLFSLCLVVYRALTGRPPFTGHNPVRIAKLALRSGPPDPSAFVEVREDLILALRIGLAARPEDRFQNAAELIKAFDEAFDGRLAAVRRKKGLELLRHQPWGPSEKDV